MVGHTLHRPQVVALMHTSISPGQGPVSRRSRELFGPEKPFVKLRPAYSVKLVFSYVVKGMKIKITAKFRASRRLRFEDTKRIMSPEIRPKSFGTFKKRAPDVRQPALVSVADACQGGFLKITGQFSLLSLQTAI